MNFQNLTTMLMHVAFVLHSHSHGVLRSLLRNDSCNHDCGVSLGCLDQTMNIGPTLRLRSGDALKSDKLR